MNKLYAFAVVPSADDVIDVIDCDDDTVVQVIILPGGGFKTLLLVPEDNMLWYLGTNHVVAIDCLGDSIVADALDNLGSIDDACASPQDRKIFAGWGGRPLWIVDMNNPAHVETLQTIPNVGMRFCNVPNAHKVYWCANYTTPYPGHSVFRAIDSRTNVITATFSIPYQVSGMRLDHTGNYVYCTGYEVNVLLVIDTRTDSVLTMFDLPSSTFGPPLLNRMTNRVYPSSSGNPIPVVRDSMLIGLEELKSTERISGVGPTLVSRSVPFRSTTPAELYDASGRRVAVLRSGLNDIRRLAPGVYFVREEQAGSRKQSASSVRKVVLTE